MSVIGKSVGDNTAVKAVQPVALFDPATGVKGSLSVGANAGGLTVTVW